MGFENNATRIRRELLVSLARLLFDETLVERIDQEPVRRWPRRQEPLRCCIYKERAITRYQFMALLGHQIEDETDEMKLLSAYAREALERETFTGPILTVIDEACRGCVRSRYSVTDACRGCVARPCLFVCPKDAITFHGGRSHIDGERCIGCGRCAQVCPYHAIIRIPVPCEEACPVGAISKDENGKEQINYDACIFCGKCMMACPFGAIMERSEMVDVVRRLKRGDKVVLLLAPAVIGQFPGSYAQLVAGFKALGFHAVIEVAHGADETTAREAAELVERLHEGQPYMTTSCCPAYTQAVRKHIPELAPRISDTRSPMHYSAAAARRDFPGCVTVFIGPCVAKRRESQEDPEVDFVLTFEEAGALFIARDVDVASIEAAELPAPASGEGRGFPVTGGVAHAVACYLQGRLDVRAQVIDGLDGKTMRELRRISRQGSEANLIEVMGCTGGCIAGPAVIANTKVVAKKIEKYVADSPGIRGEQPTE